VSGLIEVNSDALGIMHFDCNVHAGPSQPESTIDPSFSSFPQSPLFGKFG
jgi:hypothetical protein